MLSGVYGFYACTAVVQARVVGEVRDFRRDLGVKGMCCCSVAVASKGLVFGVVGSIGQQIVDGRTLLCSCLLFFRSAYRALCYCRTHTLICCRWERQGERRFALAGGGKS